MLRDDHDLSLCCAAAAPSCVQPRQHKDSRHRVGRRVERLRAVALGRRHACLLGRPVRMASAGPTLTSVQLLRSRGADAEPVLLGSAHDVSSFGYFERKAVREMLAFVGRTVAKRTPEGQRQSVAHEAYICHAYNRGGLVGLCFVGKDYPSRAAFSVVNRALDDYCQAHGEGWRAATQDGAQGDEAAQAVLTKFQVRGEAPQGPHTPDLCAGVGGGEGSVSPGRRRGPLLFASHSTAASCWPALRFRRAYSAAAPRPRPRRA